MAQKQKRRLVLLGGGHSHALALCSIAKGARANDWQVVLACGDSKVAYSGMIPGALAGLYRPSKVFIDVEKLAAQHAVPLVKEHAASLDSSRRIVRLESGIVLNYDLLSINVGGTILPDWEQAGANCCPVKPVAAFLEWWANLPPNPSRTIAVIGSGVAGAEVALSLDARMRRMGRYGGVFLVGSNNKLMADYPKFARAISSRLAKRGISQLLGSKAVAVHKDYIELANGMRTPITEAVVVTGVKTWPGLQESGLATDEDGFAKVNRRLQSISHPEVFAAGDCISFTSRPLKRAGVYAVRQASALADNLNAAMAGSSQRLWRGDGHALAIICEGDGTAVAHRAGWGTVRGRWVWRWKDYLDRKFMRKLGMTA